MPLHHDESLERQARSIEITRPVPLQEVAEGIFCGPPAEVVDERRDEEGLSDDGSEVARSVSPSLPLLSVAELLPLLARAYVRAAVATRPHLRHVTRTATDAADPAAPVMWRHDPYRPVLPDWFMTIASDESPIENEARDGEGAGEHSRSEEYYYDYDYERPEGCDDAYGEGFESYVVNPTAGDYQPGDWDAPTASLPATSGLVHSATGLGASSTVRMLADPFAGVEEELSCQDEAQRPKEATNINASPNVMCCYFKQFGRCKMGSDCWYSHDGDANTPCHYGAICKAGHAHLVKTGNASVPPKRAGDVKQQQRSRGPSGGVVPPAVSSSTRNKQVGPSAPLTPSNLPCAFCGDSQGVLLQEFPVYEGNTRSMAYRAHCINPTCMRVYSL